jgi:hypothetical protein
MATAPAYAQEGSTLLYRELVLVGGASEDNGKVTEIRRNLRNSVGMEYLRKISDETGDRMTINVQARVSYDSRVDEEDRIALEIHNAWLDYKLGMGKSIRVGHFAPAFGLEPVLDTHGTIFQTLAMPTLGFKKDWGVGYRGAVGRFDLDVALQLGSGMSIHHDDGSYLASARIGRPPGDDLQYGLSVVTGDVLVSRGMRTIPAPSYNDRTVTKSRGGLDVQYRWGSYLFMGEASVGISEDDNAAGVLGEVHYTVPRLQELTIIAQGSHWSDDTGNGDGDNSLLGLGADLVLSQAWTARAAILREDDADGEGDTMGVVQMYYFGE